MVESQIENQIGNDMEPGDARRIHEEWNEGRCRSKTCKLPGSVRVMLLPHRGLLEGVPHIGRRFLRRCTPFQAPRNLMPSCYWVDAKELKVSHYHQKTAAFMIRLYNGNEN